MGDQFLNPKNNAIGFVRLLLASCVLFGHGFELGGYGIDSQRWGVLAVLGFFFLSGMLVSQSFERSGSFMDFLWRRIVRVYPGYWASLLVSAFILIPIVWVASHGSLAGYFGGGEASPGRYVLKSAPLIFGFEDNIRNIFGANPFPTAVNGSLWTLSIEFICYVALGALAVAGALKRPVLALILSAAGIGLATMHLNPSVPPLLRKLFEPAVLELYGAFSLGVAAYVYRNRVRIVNWAGALSGIVCAAILWKGLGSVGDAIRAICAAYFVLWLAAVVPLRHFDRKIDLSYGVYIYAFPIQQSLVYFGVARSAPMAFFAFSAVATAALAFLSWTFVEAPAMRLKKAFAPRMRAVIPAQAIVEHIQAKQQDSEEAALSMR